MRHILITLLVLVLPLSVGLALDTSLALPFLMRAPQGATSSSNIIIMLHGIGSNERDLFAMATEFPKDTRIISVRAPITLGSNSYGWYHLDLTSGKPVYSVDEEQRSRALIIRFIEQIRQRLKARADQMYLYGFSQGAIMSYGVALTRPDLVHGIFIMSGRLIEAVKTNVASNDALKNLRIFISHGTSDAVLPVDNARKARAYLESLGVSPHYHEYAAAHEITAAMMKDALQWLRE